MNSLQIPLLNDLDDLTEDAPDPTITERFAEFDSQNPQVFESLKRLCLEMKHRGMPRWSIKAAYETCRWLPMLHREPLGRGTTARLCNDFHALYSRKLMAEVPELDGFFECRARRAE